MLYLCLFQEECVLCVSVKLHLAIQSGEKLFCAQTFCCHGFKWQVFGIITCNLLGSECPQEQHVISEMSLFQAPFTWQSTPTIKYYKIIFKNIDCGSRGSNVWEAWYLALKLRSHCVLATDFLNCRQYLWLTTWGRWILQRIQQIHSQSQSSQTSTRRCHRPLKLCTLF